MSSALRGSSYARTSISCGANGPWPSRRNAALRARGTRRRGLLANIPEMKLPTEMMKLAQHIIRTKSAEFDPSMLEDHYRGALLRILRKKHAKRPTQSAAPVKPSRENVVNLMDALRRSIAAEGPTKPAPRRHLRKSASPKRPVRARTRPL